MKASRLHSSVSVNLIQTLQILTDLLESIFIFLSFWSGRPGVSKSSSSESEVSMERLIAKYFLLGTFQNFPIENYMQVKDYINMLLKIGKS